MIYKHQITRIGSFHLDYCEDYAVCIDLGKDRQLLAVMDGCTMGEESYFASALFGRLLRKIGKEAYYKEYIEGRKTTVSDQIKSIVGSLFEEVILAKNLLHLEREELLTTVLLAVLDDEENQGEIVCIGDGVVCIDGSITEFNQDNQPDYLAYHLGEKFDDWYEGLRQKLRIEKFTDISLCTDGILTFADKESSKIREDQLDRIIKDLLLDRTDLKNENMFIKKMHRIEAEWGLINTDDVGIVRVVLDDGVVE